MNRTIAIKLGDSVVEVDRIHGADSIATPAGTFVRIDVSPNGPILTDAMDPREAVKFIKRLREEVGRHG